MYSLQMHDGLGKKYFYFRFRFSSARRNILLSFLAPQQKFRNIFSLKKRCCVSQLIKLRRYRSTTVFRNKGYILVFLPSVTPLALDSHHLIDLFSYWIYIQTYREILRNGLGSSKTACRPMFLGISRFVWVQIRYENRSI